MVNHFNYFYRGGFQAQNEIRFLNITEKYLPPNSCLSSSVTFGFLNRSGKRDDLFALPKKSINFILDEAELSSDLKKSVSVYLQHNQKILPFSSDLLMSMRGSPSLLTSIVIATIKVK